MKRFNSFLILILICNILFSQKAFGQSSQLEFIDDYPIKIDGECSFFTYDTTNLTTDKYVFVVSGNKTAFFKKDGEFVFLHRSKRQLMPLGYIDSFRGSGYTMTLDLKKGLKIGPSQTIFAGTLKILQKNKVEMINVIGINEEYEFNK